MNIIEIRRQYPEYSDIPDDQLLKGLHAKHYSDMPYADFVSRLAPDYGEPVVEGGQYQIGGPVTVEAEEIAGGLVEPALTMGSGMVAGTVAPIGGAVVSGAEPLRAAVTGEYQNPLAGVEARDKIIEGMTYKPRTESGMKAVQRFADIMQGIGETKIPYTDTQIGELPEMARLGDEALDAGMPGPVAMVAEGIPEYIGAAVTATGLPAARRGFQPRMKLDKTGGLVSDMSKKQQIAMNLRNNPENPSTAGHQLAPRSKYSPFSGPKVIKDPVGKMALSQGWSDDLVAGVKGANEATKAQVRKMVNTARNRLTGGLEVKNRIRPSDVLGKSLFSRYETVKMANSDAGKMLNTFAKRRSAMGDVIDMNGPVAWLRKQLSDSGVSILPDGKIDFSSSTLPKSDFGLIRENLKQLGIASRGKPHFYKMHKLKQSMRRNGLNYEPTPVKAGASRETQDMFKGFSGRIDELLDGRSKAYDMGNMEFAETASVLDPINRIAKNNLYITSADKFLGKTMKRITSNAVSRDAIVDMIDDLDRVANKHGGNFKDNLFVQQSIVKEMDDILGAAAESSIKGELGPQAAGALRESSIGHIARVAEHAAKAVTGKTEERALDALMGLTR